MEKRSVSARLAKLDFPVWFSAFIMARLKTKIKLLFLPLFYLVLLIVPGCIVLYWLLFLNQRVFTLKEDMVKL